MIVLLIIYILGVIAALWAFYHNMESGDELLLLDFFLILIGSFLFSWVGFGVWMLIIYGDKIVFKKK